MKLHIKTLVFFILAGLFCACSNDSDNDGSNSGAFPEASTISSTTFYHGEEDEVVIKGKNLGINIENVKLSISGIGDMVAKSVADTEIRFTFPAIELEEFEREQKTTLYLSILYDGSFRRILEKEITILYKEPKGWSFIGSTTVARIGGEGATSFGICDDGTLWAFGFQHCVRSYDGGLSWENAIAGNSNRNGYLFNKNTGWANNFMTGHVNVMRGSVDFAGVDFTPISVISNTSAFYVTKMWMDGVESGILVYEEGFIFSVDELKDGKVFLMYNDTDKVLLDMAATGKYDFTAYAQLESNNSKKYLIHKNDGEAPVEYEIGGYAKQGISQLQRLKDGTVYFINSENDLYRVTWPFAVVKLEQKADRVHFIDENIAYLVYKGIVYKTVNGAQSWTIEHTIENEERSVAKGICVKNGQVWILLTSKAINSSAGYILKYNP